MREKKKAKVILERDMRNLKGSVLPKVNTKHYIKILCMTQGKTINLGPLSSFLERNSK